VLSLVTVLSLSACSKSPAGAEATAVQASPAAAAQSTPAEPAKPVPAQLPDVLARVNGEAVSRAEFERAVQALESRAGGPVPAEQRDQVLRGVLWQGMRIVLGGLVVGLGGAFAATRLMASQLYDVEPTDPLTFVLVAVTLAAAALVASLLPSLRATRVDPMAALRYE
jgi:hypothetical protein